MAVFRVVDMSAAQRPDISLVARSAEQAGMAAVGNDLVRSGSPQNLNCKVYWTDGEKTNMIRLYRRKGDFF